VKCEKCKDGYVDWQAVRQAALAAVDWRTSSRDGMRGLRGPAGWRSGNAAVPCAAVASPPARKLIPRGRSV